MEKNKCASCGAEDNLQMHHWLYLDEKEKEKGWTTILCRSCHQKLHLKHGVGNSAEKNRSRYLSKLIEVDGAIWKRFEIVAVAEFGLYGAITKGVGKAIEEWVQKEEEK